MQFLICVAIFSDLGFQSVRYLPKEMRLRKIRGYAIGTAIGRCCCGSDDKSGSCETNEKYTWTTYSN